MHGPSLDFLGLDIRRNMWVVVEGLFDNYHGLACCGAHSYSHVKTCFSKLLFWAPALIFTVLYEMTGDMSMAFLSLPSFDAIALLVLYFVPYQRAITRVEESIKRRRQVQSAEQTAEQVYTECTVGRGVGEPGWKLHGFGAGPQFGPRSPYGCARARG